MAGRPHSAPRTMLEHLLREGDRGYAESAKEFERVARARGVGEHQRPAPAPPARGGTTPTPVTRRVLQVMFGQPTDVLLGPWQQQLETGVWRDSLLFSLLNGEQS